MVVGRVLEEIFEVEAPPEEGGIDVVAVDALAGTYEGAVGSRLEVTVSGDAVRIEPKAAVPWLARQSAIELSRSGRGGLGVRGQLRGSAVGFFSDTRGRQGLMLGRDAYRRVVD